MTSKITLDAILKADTLPMKLIHQSSWACAGLFPLGMYMGPGILSWPVDMALGVALPVHSHIMMNNVISDYAPKISKSPLFLSGMRCGLLGLTGVTMLGFLKLNLGGQGVTETVKQMWRPKKDLKGSAF
mmetsp:Transcript_31752/g.61170  ORF Transcript_31752/g.61170 Transcript_31752/m.61170 type:complete len:129 (-) Transcript_31752:458-844(-)|eukprot:CAMPEP_0114253148 /NCGR_PEP_ID=MMETSP0058-20121206/16232_1 /TAXON_ID=36894 /ORGANISM="Pyramimonas parkeae, CCMP726" /LENGTH=128 /DNA_ID=CAMNT_0001367163 /DNA_START=101 /DNA_END=487 /DNA_ORIENTATION=-